MKLIFIRHAHPDYERDALTLEGVKEAEALQKRVDRWDIDRVLVSPLGRAQETAKIALGLNMDSPLPERIVRDGKEASVETVDWLQEFDAYMIKRPDLGGEDGICWDWLPSEWTTHDAFYDPTGWLSDPAIAESIVPQKYKELTEALDRVMASCGYIRDGLVYRVERECTDRIVFFTHYGLTCTAMAHLLSMSPMQLWHGVCMCPTSVTKITTEERRPGTASLRTDFIGDRSHLYAAGIPYTNNAKFTEVFSDPTGRKD